MNYEFQTLVYDVFLNSYHDVMNLIFFSDVHHDTQSLCKHSWNEFNKESKQRLQNNKNTFFIGVGDYQDFMASSERKKIKNSDIHETTVERLDRIVKQDSELFLKDISYMKDHTIGLSEGNHTWIYQDGVSSTEYLCKNLNTTYLRWLFVVCLRIHIHKSRILTVKICGCHGKYSGKRAGATINGVEDLIKVISDCDIYVMGHDHHRGVIPIASLETKLCPDNKLKLREKYSYLCRSGSFKKGIIEGKSSYECKSLLSPSVLGGLFVKIQPKRIIENNEEHLTYKITTEI